MAPAPAEAFGKPFKAPRGTVVVERAATADATVWNVYFPDYTASAVVGRSKLSASSLSAQSFKKFINSAVMTDQNYSKYGVKVKTTWRKSTYTLSGTGAKWRLYMKGWLGKDGYWYFGSMQGKKGKGVKEWKTNALVKMIKNLK